MLRWLQGTFASEEKTKKLAIEHDEETGMEGGWQEEKEEVGNEEEEEEEEEAEEKDVAAGHLAATSSDPEEKPKKKVKLANPYVSPASRSSHPVIQKVRPTKKG